MQFSQELNDAFNEQVLKEFANMLLYKQAESLFEDLQLENLAKYFHKQAKEEKQHGNKFIKYINKRTGGKVTCGDVPFPLKEELSLSNVGKVYIEAEENTTKSIEELYQVALDEKSFMDLGFLERMLNIQVGEEDEANEFALAIEGVKDIVLFDATFKD